MPYVGIDAHRTTAHITVTNEKGQVLKRKQTASSAVGVRKALAGYHGPMKVVLETSSTWGSTYDWLTEIAHVVVLAHPANVRAIVDARIKSDRIDSHTLAHLLRADLIPQASAPAKAVRAVKRGLRQRMFFVPHAARPPGVLAVRPDDMADIQPLGCRFPFGPVALRFAAPGCGST